MMPRVVAVKPSGEYRIWLRFADGAEGEIDLESELWGEVFTPLKDQRLFAEVAVSTDLDTIYWPNGADFAPEFLYEKLAAGRRRALA